jgi:hypothetical protein
MEDTSSHSQDDVGSVAPILTVRDVIGLWPSRKAMADDLEAVGGGAATDAVTAERVHKWATRGVIPAGYHGRVLRAAARRGVALTADDLVAIHDFTPSEKDAA